MTPTSFFGAFTLWDWLLTAIAIILAIAWPLTKVALLVCFVCILQVIALAIEAAAVAAIKVFDVLTLGAFVDQDNEPDTAAPQDEWAYIEKQLDDWKGRK
ncbi:hypothetical protein ACTOV4_10105 [Brucella sp. C7-11G]